MTQLKRHVILGFETELRMLNTIALATERFVASCLNLLGATGFGPSHSFVGKKPKSGM